MRFTWKSKQNAAEQLARSFIANLQRTRKAQASSSPAWPLPRKTNSFSQFPPTEIRLSTSVFVKLKGLNSQWRAARRNFPLLVFYLVSIPLNLESTKGSGKITIVVNIIRMHTSARFTSGNPNKMPFIAGDLFALKRNAGMETGCAAPLWNVVNAAEKQ